MMTIGNRRGALLVDLLRSGRAAVLPVHGSSMRPLLRDGDRVVVEPVGARPVRRHDIVLALQGDRLAVHRVVQVRPLLTQGDALDRPDSPGTEAHVVGRVTELHRWNLRVRLDSALGRALSDLSLLRARLRRTLRGRS